MRFATFHVHIPYSIIKKKGKVFGLFFDVLASYRQRMFSPQIEIDCVFHHLVQMLFGKSIKTHSIFCDSAKKCLHYLFIYFGRGGLFGVRKRQVSAEKRKSMCWKGSQC